MGIKRPLFWESTTTVLHPNERLTQLFPDWHTRRAIGGENRVFMCEDKYGFHLLLSQKVTLLADHISKIASDRSERISTTSLYSCLENDGTGLNGGYAKHRWKLKSYPRERAVEAFEAARAPFKTVTILGSKSCIKTSLCV